MELLKKAIEVQPNNTRALHNLGTAYKELGKLKEAINYYKNKALYKHASFVSKNKCVVNKKIFSEEAEEIIFKSFKDSFKYLRKIIKPKLITIILCI